MSKVILSLFVISVFLFLPVASRSTVMKPIPVVASNDHTPGPASLKTREVEKLIGRKLTFKEKVGLFILKKVRPAVSTKGETALIFAIIGASLLLIGLFVPYVIIAALPAAIVAVVLGSVAKRENPSDNKAHAATLLGWITLGAFALILIAAVALSAAWSWG
jgi:hypothetical protein